jgi:tetratricopeptide (TPR) repeat protein
MNRQFETKTNRRGDYVQIGLQSGPYKITAKKDDMIAAQQVQIRLGNMSEVNFVLTPGAGPLMTAEEAEKMKAKLDAATAAFEEGVALSQANQDDAAIAKFQEVIGTIDTCGECYVNIGAIYARNKRYDEAEKAFKTAIEQNPNLPDAYNGLANVYNALRKFDEAAEASAKAQELQAASGAGPADAGAVFNQGVILWNSGKIAEAKVQFEKAVELDPNMAEAHYWLGMANLNEGKLPEAVGYFEKYVELAPEGQYAAQAKGVIAQLKK